MSSAKKTARKLALQALRDMDSKQRERESAAVCTAVWSRVIVPAAARLATAIVPPSPSESVVRARLAVLAYLPMSYELSLLPLMQHVWATNEEAPPIETSEGAPLMPTLPPSVCVETFVPHMVPIMQGDASPLTPLTPPTAASATPKIDVDAVTKRSTSGGKGGEMMFVQVRSLDDMQGCFTPRGKMNILELTEDAEKELMSTVLDDAARMLDLCPPVTEATKAAARATAASAPRRGYMCFGSTARHIPPPPEGPPRQPTHHSRHHLHDDAQTPRLASGYLRTPRSTLSTVSSNALLTQESSTTSALETESSSQVSAIPPPPRFSPPELTTLVILTPAALYDVAGGRLGKGGGFYDLFLRRAAGLRGGGGAFHEVLVVGVGLSPQLLGGADAATFGPGTVVSLTSNATVTPPSQDAAVDDATNVRVLHIIPALEPTATVVTPTAAAAAAASPDVKDSTGCMPLPPVAVQRVPMDPWDETVDELIIAC